MVAIVIKVRYNVSHDETWYGLHIYGNPRLDDSFLSAQFPVHGPKMDLKWRFLTSTMETVRGSVKKGFTA